MKGRWVGGWRIKYGVDKEWGEEGWWEKKVRGSGMVEQEGEGGIGRRVEWERRERGCGGRKGGGRLEKKKEEKRAREESGREVGLGRGVVEERWRRAGEGGGRGCLCGN